MPRRSFRFLVRGVVGLCLVASAMIVLAGGIGAQGPAGAPKIPPMAGANAVPTSPDLDQLAQSVAQTLGFDPQYAYEVWAIPGATWDSAFKYYSDQIAGLGWKDPGTQGDFQPGAKMGNFINADTKLGISIVFVAKEGGGVLYVISGSAASKATAAANRVDSKGKLNPDGTFATSGQYIADLGFRPDTSGFPFQNYGAGNFTNLTPAELRRVFGDQACQSLQDNTCILQPQLKELMDKWNKSMEGGHCYGFSQASLRFYMKQLNPSDFGGTSVADLPLDANDKLQREIAYNFVGQNLPPVTNNKIAGTPNDVLDQLISNLKAGPSATETYTIGFYKADGNGGHAVTPYAVEDLGGGINAVLIYDNNWPKATRAILFDRNANKWSYDAATNPQVASELYWGNGDTKSLFLFPTTPATKVVAQSCPYCAPKPGRVTGMAAPALSAMNTIYLDRNAGAEIHLLITDANGKRYGYLSDGTFVTEIPGVTIERPMVGGVDSWNKGVEPVYFVPADLKFTLTIDGSLLKDTDVASVALIGPGYDIGIEDINLDPKQKDTLTLSPDGTQLSYKTTSSESPDIIAATENSDGSVGYSFLVKGADVDGGGTINLSLDPTKGQLKLNTNGTKNAGTYGLLVDRYDNKSEQTFWHDNIALGPTDTAILDYGKWTGNKASLSLGIDRNSTGTIAETVELTDTEPSTSVPKPAIKPNATAMTPTADLIDLAAGVADAAGFTNFSYEAWQLPAGSTWNDTFAYYSQQMTQLGWADKPTQDEFEDGRVGEWINPANNTGLAVYYSSNPYDNAPPFVVIAYGVATPVPDSKPDWKPLDKSADVDKIAAAAASTFGFAGYVYQPWSLGASTTWDSILKYANDQMKQMGWSGDGTTQDSNGNKIGAWIDPITKLGTVLLFVPSPDGSKPAEVFTLVGLSAKQ